MPVVDAPPTESFRPAFVEHAGSFAVIDDVAAASVELSELGRRVIWPAARLIRYAVQVRARSAGWRFIAHSDFASWALRRSADDSIAMILDPLLASNADSERAVRFHVTRTATDDGWRLDAALPAAVECAVRGKPVVIIDDASVTGLTLLRILELVAAAGALPAEVRVCTATDLARARVLAAYPDLRFDRLIDEDCSSIHLRDGCPFIPHGGRKVDDRPPIAARTGAVEVRIHPVAFQGGPWRALALSPVFRDTLATEMATIADRFSWELGRPATVADVPLLGEGVRLTLFPPQIATADTLLESVLK